MSEKLSEPRKTAFNEKVNEVTKGVSDYYGKNVMNFMEPHLTEKLSPSGLGSKDLFQVTSAARRKMKENAQVARKLQYAAVRTIMSAAYELTDAKASLAENPDDDIQSAFKTRKAGEKKEKSHPATVALKQILGENPKIKPIKVPKEAQKSIDKTKDLAEEIEAKKALANEKKQSNRCVF